MNISPYLYPEVDSDPFIAHANEIQNAYFWASVMELGTGVNTHSIQLPEEGMEYLMVDIAQPGDGCLSPEDFIDLLTGHEENKRFWGYAWTIHHMNERWKSIVGKALPNKEGNADRYAIEINLREQRVSIVDKEYVWKLVNQLEF